MEQKNDKKSRIRTHVAEACAFTTTFSLGVIWSGSTDLTAQVFMLATLVAASVLVIYNGGMLLRSRVMKGGTRGLLTWKTLWVASNAVLLPIVFFVEILSRWGNL